MKSSSNIIAIGVIAALIIGAGFAVSMAFAGSPRQAATTGTPGAATTGTAQATPVPPSFVRVWSSMCVEGVPYTLLSVPPDTKFALVEESVAGAVTPGATLTAIAGTPQASSGTGVPVTGGTGTPAASMTTETPQATLSSGTSQAGGTGVPVTGGTGSLGVVPGQNSCTALGTASGQQLVLCTGPQAAPFTLFVHGSQGSQTYKSQLWDCTIVDRTPRPDTPTPGTGTPSTGMPSPVSGPTDTPVATTPTAPMPTNTP